VSIVTALNFIPQLWESKLLIGFRQAAVWAALTNREYEGALTSGNQLNITGLTEIAVKDYKAAGRTTSADAISDTTQSLLINQEKNFDFKVDDIDRIQAAGSFGEYTASAAYGLANDADLFLANLAFSTATALTTTAGTLGANPTDATSAWNALRDVRKSLNKAKVPQGDRVVIFNAEFEALLDANDAKLMASQTAGTTDGLRNASLGRMLGFDTYTTENMQSTAKPQVIGLHKSALAFASQVQSVEGMRDVNSFADRVRGLHVYGAKTIRPTGIVSVTAA
jgi:hypothetical protein